MITSPNPRPLNLTGGAEYSHPNKLFPRTKTSRNGDTPNNTTMTEANRTETTENPTAIRRAPPPASGYSTRILPPPSVLDSAALSSAIS